MQAEARGGQRACRRPECAGSRDSLLRSHAVCAFAVLARDGVDAQAHFLFDSTAQKATDGVGLPAGRLSELWERSAGRPAQQRENLGSLGASPCRRGGFARARWFLAALGSCSGGVGAPVGDARFGCSFYCGLSRLCFSDVFIFVFLWRQVAAVNSSLWLRRKASEIRTRINRRRRNGDARLAAPAEQLLKLLALPIPARLAGDCMQLALGNQTGMFRRKE